jgi:hypothetical protein
VSKILEEEWVFFFTFSKYLKVYQSMFENKIKKEAWRDNIDLKTVVRNFVNLLKRKKI